MSKDIYDTARRWYRDSSPDKAPFVTWDDRIFVAGEGWAKIAPERAVEIRRARR